MIETANLYRADTLNHHNPEYMAKTREIREEWWQLLRDKLKVLKELKEQVSAKEKE
ncbi:hypothetical protein [Aurantivibrio plasticivorans]